MLKYKTLEFEALKSAVSDLSTDKKEQFILLRQVCDFVNKSTIETEADSRELVIRLLAKENELVDFSPIIHSLVRTVGLFPYLAAPEKLSTIDHLAYEMHRVDNLYNIVFHSLQAQVYEELIHGNNVVLSGSTSVGKSLVIDALIASDKFKKIVLIVPTIALIDETRKRISARFKESWKIITHQTQVISENDPCVIYILTPERALLREDLDRIDLFILDEFYKLDFKYDSEQERAITLNLAFNKLVSVSKLFYLLGPNIQSIDGLNKYSHRFIPSDFCTVATDYTRYDYPKSDERRNLKLIELCKELDQQTLIYCQSPSSASKIVKLLLEKSVGKPKEGLSTSLEWIRENYHKDWVFYQALAHGIGVHHGAIPRALQQHCISLFNQEILDYLVCTSTIIEGVNTSAKNVIIYDRRKGNNDRLDFFTYKNIEGRAGRMKHHLIGRVYSLEACPEEELTHKVEIPLGKQDENTPIPYLLHLDETELAPISSERLKYTFSNIPISLETIKFNHTVSFESQIELAEKIVNYPNLYKDDLLWTGLPNASQLCTACHLIYDHLGNRALRRYEIKSGQDLYRRLVILDTAKGYSKYIHSQIVLRFSEGSISDVIDEELRFIRNVVCYRIPTYMRALESIQKDIYKRLGYEKVGNYSVYTSKLENLFMDPALFALDEYGIPLETLEKLDTILQPNNNLDELLLKIKMSEISNWPLHEFEKNILQDICNFI